MEVLLTGIRSSWRQESRRQDGLELPHDLDRELHLPRFGCRAVSTGKGAGGSHAAAVGIARRWAGPRWSRRRHNSRGYGCWIKEEFILNRWIEVGAIKEVEHVHSQLDIERFRDARHLRVLFERKIKRLEAGTGHDIAAGIAKRNVVMPLIHNRSRDLEALKLCVIGNVAWIRESLTAWTRQTIRVSEGVSVVQAEHIASENWRERLTRRGLEDAVYLPTIHNGAGEPTRRLDRRYIPDSVEGEHLRIIEIGNATRQPGIEPVQAGDRRDDGIRNDGAGSRINRLLPSERTCHLEPMAHPFDHLYFQTVVDR